MSAIAGIVAHTDRPVTDDDIRAMIRTMHHRGAERETQEVDGLVALGGCRSVATEAPASGALYRTPDGLLVTADARIDNRDELTGVLDVAAGAPDAAYIAAAYRAWGTQAAERLIGDFAFAIWDTRNRTLYGARDPMGVRPFYVHRHDAFFSFATEVNALLALAHVPRRLSERAITYYLAKHLNDQETTFFEDIYRLPPAHAVLIRDGRVEQWRYWRLDPDRELHFADEREYVEGFRDVFAEAVAARLRTRYAVGFQLSGGLDSSSVTCMAHTLRPSTPEQPLHTFSGIYPGLPEQYLAEIDERAYVEAVLKKGTFEAHYVHADTLSPFEGLEAMLAMHGEPFYLRSHALVYAMLQRVQQAGVRVLLDGSEGDVAVNYGYMHMTELARARQWPTFTAVAEAFAEQCRLQRRNHPAPLSFWRYGFAALNETLMQGRALAYLGDARTVSRSFGIPLTRVARYSATTIGRSYLKRLRAPRLDARQAEAAALVHDRLRQRIDIPYEQGKEPRTQREAHIRALESGQLTSNLEVFNHLAIPFGIEPRHPCYDRRLLEYCVALPAGQTFRGARPRGILREAMDGILPDTVRDRLGKSDLGLGFSHNLLHMESERLKRLLVTDIEPVSDFINVDEVRNAYARFIEQPIMERAMPLLQVAVLSTWLRKNR